MDEETKAGYNGFVDQVVAAKLAVKRAVGGDAEQAVKYDLQEKE